MGQLIRLSNGSRGQSIHRLSCSEIVEKIHERGSGVFQGISKRLASTGTRSDEKEETL
jgi:hypothetical protein